MSALRIIRLALCVVAFCGLGACHSGEAPSIERALAGLPAKNLKSYSFDPASSLSDRVLAAPEFLLKYLRDMDQVATYTAYLPTEAERQQLSGYLDLLPKAYLDTLQQRLIGIYFIDKWSGSGMADYVLDDKQQTYTILIINPETLRHGISEWMTYRESTAFQPAPGQVKIVVDCGTTYTGLLYLLLHETSHIMDYVHHFTPYVEEDMRRIHPSAKETNFTKGIWTEYGRPLPAFDFRRRQELSFYGIGNRPLLAAAEAPAIYAALRESPFVSLYGSRDWAEDFAECSTWYYFTSKLQQPFRVILTTSEKLEATYEPMKFELVKQRMAVLPVASE